MKEVFDSYAFYYDSLNNSKDYYAESEYVINSIYTYKPNCKKILEFGSGTGKHAINFIDKEFYYRGIEYSSKMIEYCEEELRNKMFEGDIRTFKFGEKFDAVVSLYHVISYLNSEKDLIQCFKNANEHLNEGGLFLFDVWYLPAVYKQDVETRVRRFENEKHKIIRIAESEINEIKNTCDVKFSIYVLDKEKHVYNEIIENHTMRFFTYEDICNIARKTGFEILEAKPFMNEGELNNESWGAFFILKK